jgi:hypothetical protein
MAEKETKLDRRAALRALSVGVIGSTAVNMNTAAAQDASSFQLQRLSETTGVDIKNLQLPLSDGRARRSVKLSDRLPDDTPIEKMGLTRAAELSLTNGALGLTKADLVALSEGKTTSFTEKLTVADIKSVQIAFGSGYTASRAANATALNGVSCCCCTPCCCAATEHIASNAA